MKNFENKLSFISLSKYSDPRGNLTVIEQFKDIPFEIKRIYWIYDVPGGQIRGGHAFKEQKELIIALSGSFDVVTCDGKLEQRNHLNRSYFGLYVPNKIWRYMDNFSTNSVVLILSSTFFNEDDYIRNYKEYIRYKKHV